MTQPLLSVRNLVTQFRTSRGTITAVNKVSFDVAAGETVAIVGDIKHSRVARSDIDGFTRLGAKVVLSSPTSRRVITNPSFGSLPLGGEAPPTL
jgi:ABC-type antimicrobial peptide transport system ATPase subunit